MKTIKDLLEHVIAAQLSLETPLKLFVERDGIYFAVSNFSTLVTCEPARYLAIEASGDE